MRWKIFLGLCLLIGFCFLITALFNPDLAATLITDPSGLF